MFRTSSEKKGERERVRLALQRAALRLSALHGFASIGLREVAREAGIAPTSFYRHFADMQELGATLSAELVGEAIARVCHVLGKSQGPWGAVLWDAMNVATGCDPELIRFLAAERVGAFAALRASLHGQLASLAKALSAVSGANVAAADAAVTLSLDASARALDGTQGQRAALQESCVWAVDTLLSLAAAPAMPKRKSGKVAS